MARAFDINATREYVLTEDRGKPEDEQTKFHLGVLDSRLAAKLSDKSKAFGVNAKGDDDSAATVTLQFDTMHWDVVRYGLKGWDNFPGKDGAEVKCVRKNESVAGVGNRMGLTPESMDYLKPYIDELAKEILKDSQVTEDEKRGFS